MLASFVVTQPPSPNAPRFLLGKNEKHPYSPMLPAVRPGLITVGLFAFLTAWNDFMAPLILINDSDRLTLPLAVSNLRGQVQGVVDYGATEAGVVVLALPCAVLFLLLQRHYVRGFMSGALKG